MDAAAVSCVPLVLRHCASHRCRTQVASGSARTPRRLPESPASGVRVSMDIDPNPRFSGVMVGAHGGEYSDASPWYVTRW